MARTPGRTPAKHAPFRNDTLVGKRSGKSIPHGPRSSDGYEHFNRLIQHSDNYTPPQRGVKRKKNRSPSIDEVPDSDAASDGELSMELDSPLLARRMSAGKPKPRQPSAREVMEQELEDEEEEEEHGGIDSDDEEDEQEVATKATPKYRKGKAKALTPVREADDEEEDEDAMEDEIAMGLQEAEQYQSEQEEEDETPPRKKSKPSPKAPVKLKAKPAPKAKPARRRRSSLNSDPPEGVRRSQRVSYAPLEFWRNERVVYAPRESGHPRQVPHIQEIVRIPKEDEQPLAKRKRSAPRSRSRTQTRVVEREVIIETDNPEAGWDDETVTEAEVLDFKSGERVMRRVAFTANMFNPQPARVSNADTDGWSFEKLFSDSDFMAAGQLTIPPKKRKPSKAAKDNTYIFYVVQGGVNVTVGDNSLILAKGGMFMVPRGNSYLIENISDREAKLFFTQARKIADEDEEGSVSASASGTPGVQVRLPSVATSRR